MYDILIVGAGPAGLAVAIEAKKKNLNHIIIDKGSALNSIVGFPKDMIFFSTSELLEIGGIPFTSNDIRPTRREAILYYQKVIDHFNLNLKTYQKFINLHPQNDGFKITTKQFNSEISEEENTYLSKHIVIATGFYDHPKFLNVKGENLPHVSHYYSEPFPFYNCNVLVVGGGNSAVEAALDMFRHGVKVTLLHKNRQIKQSIKYWVLPDIQNRINQGSIPFIGNAKIMEITKKGIYYKQNSHKKWHNCEYIFLLTGYEPDESIYKICNIRYNTRTLEPEFNQKNYQSSIPGLYLAGSMIAGKYSNRIFIENSRDHAKPIINDIIINLTR